MESLLHEREVDDGHLQPDRYEEGREQEAVDPGRFREHRALFRAPVERVQHLRQDHRREEDGAARVETGPAV